MKRKKICSNQLRIIAHIDLDCFYVQVERSINKDLIDKPVAVVQYNPFGDLKSLAPTDNRIVTSGSLIAVSYEARAKGVKRSMRGHEARQASPDLILIQVPTSHGKADLTIYRDASAKIVSVLSNKYSSTILERASIDEVYVDLSEESIKLYENADDTLFMKYICELSLNSCTRIAGEDIEEIQFNKKKISSGHSGTGNGILSTEIESNEHLTITSNSWLNRPLYQWSMDEKMLLCGSYLVKELRQEVFNVLGFTCSAGVAGNKMLAKIASGMHKPNKQTLVPGSVVTNLMSTLPYSRVQGFGGKLGALIESSFGQDIRTLGDVLTKITRSDLLAVLGEDTAQWVLSAAQGLDDTAVAARSLPVSIGCSKSFRSSNMLHLPAHYQDGTLLRWIRELAEELCQRVSTDSETNNRRPLQLTVGLTVLLPTANQSSTKDLAVDSRVAQWHAEQGSSLSKAGKMPNLSVSGSDVVAKQALGQLLRALADKGATGGPRITSLSLVAAAFEITNTGKNDIKSYFSSDAGTDQSPKISPLAHSEAIVATAPPPVPRSLFPPPPPLLCPEGVDPDVFSALPADIQQELQRHFDRGAAAAPAQPKAPLTGIKRFFLSSSG